ncbi:helix-turn-helix transcriptional regulator [Haladaptatus salinisoli]|uniref:helix-turn-helix transcriptional regulator n=1 Tax=Haladaptatus salinisoli TaxID=2884876 RepID=UPI001D0A5E8E|nr:hypothetical protein [Haladaptatus salinisoli]
MATNETAVNGTTIRITPQPDGDAKWNVSMEFALRSENETAAFKELGTEFARGNEEVGFSVDTFRRIIRAKTETGREMKIRDVNRGYTVNNDTGTLYLSFIWTNFTRVEGDRLLLRDAFLLDDESTWLQSLSAEQRLVLASPDGYRIQNSPNLGHNNGTIRLEGPRSLSPGEIDVTYVKEGQGQGGLPVSDFSGIALLLLALGTGGAGLYVLIQRRDESVDDSSSDERSPVAPPDPEPVPESDDEPDLDLLSDEERVEHLLEQNGGRMKQAKIVTETNWSNAKVSQLLSSMADEGRVDKLRIGRENLITLPDENVADFDDE